MSLPLVLPAQGRRDYPSPESFVQRGTSPLNLVYIGSANQTALTTASHTVDNIRAHPFVSPGGVVDTLYVEATAVVANAVGRVGIYRNTGDHTIYPSDLVVESGEVALATAVVRSVSVTAILSPGLYWAVWLLGTANPTLRCINSGGDNHIAGMSSSFARHFSLGAALAYQALPATFPAGATWVAVDRAAIGVHYAS